MLRHYYPSLRAKLAADRAASLASVRSGPAKRHGLKIGKRAARGVLDERVGDGYLDPTIHYTLPPGPGVWQPAPPATDMLGAWIGSLRHLVVKKHVKVDGPDALTSSAYTAQFEEVKSLGSAISSTRTEDQRQTALFFNSNSATMVGDALIRYLERHPIGLADDGPPVRARPRRHDRLPHPVLAAQARRRVLAPHPGDPGRRARRQPRDDRGQTLDATRARPAVLRLRQRARLPHRAGRRGDPPDPR